MIEQMKAKQSLKAAELQDGDIICFQLSEGISVPDSSLTNGTPNGGSSAVSVSKSPDPVARGDRQRQQGFIDDARDWYDYLLNSKVIRFAPHPKQPQPHTYSVVDLHLSTRLTYDQLAGRVGEKVGVDPSHLRFFTINMTTGNPKTPVKRNPNQTLHHILTPQYGQYTNGHRPDALFYEVLDISLSELDTKKNIKITWLSEGITKEVTILLPRYSGLIFNNAIGTFRRSCTEDWNYRRSHQWPYQKGTS